MCRQAPCDQCRFSDYDPPDRGVGYEGGYGCDSSDPEADQSDPECPVFISVSANPDAQYDIAKEEGRIMD